MTKPIDGIADTHAHFAAEFECGGSFFWGRTFSHAHSDDARLRDALAPRWGSLTVGELQGASRGYPTFAEWPSFTTFYYQQAYIDWIYRAYQGGLRLVSCLCVNNESFSQRLYGQKGNLLTHLVQIFGRSFLSPIYPFDNKSVISLQLNAIKKTVEYVAAHKGGWMEIAHSPEEAREIVGRGHLAVVLGIEVDSLGNWRKPQDLEDEARRSGTDVRTVIRCELERLYQLGVRQITPIHLTDNPFGGASVYKVVANTANVDIAGYDFKVEDGFDDGIRYRMDMDTAAPAPRKLLETLGLFEIDSDSDTPYRKGLESLRSHRNQIGLTAYGVILIEEMMRLGMLIDLDHMSEYAKNRTLEIAWANHYPLIHSHALGFRDLALTADVPYDKDAPLAAYRTSNVYNIANEFHTTLKDLEKVRDLGGMVSVLLNQGEVRDFDGPNGIKQTARATVENNCSGSSRSWAQAYLYALEAMQGQNVGLGSDVNGFAGLPGPRFGPNAAYGLDDDPYRDPDGSLRVSQAEQQSNGIHYSDSVQYTRASRFNGRAYDGDGDGALNRDIWRGIAIYAARGRVWNWSWDRAENVALGLQAGASGNESRLYWGTFLPECLHLRRAGFLVTRDREPGDGESDEIRALYGKIQQYFRRWQAQEGDNDPLARCHVGSREYDYNLDGFAHYGMLPDFLQDLHNIGLQDQHLHSLHHSAESYVQTWEKCRQRSEELFGRVTLPSADCPPEE